MSNGPRSGGVRILSTPFTVPADVDDEVLGGLGKYPCPPFDDAAGLTAAELEDEKNEGR